MNSNHYSAVKEFMNKAEQEIPSSPTVPDQETCLLRARLVMEEALELIQALGFTLVVQEQNGMANIMIAPSGNAPDLTQVADGVADVCVVANGTAFACGIDIEPIQSAVDQSNLAKFQGDAHKDENGKWIKPSDWTAPPITQLLVAQGMEVNSCCNGDSCERKECNCN